MSFQTISSIDNGKIDIMCIIDITYSVLKSLIIIHVQKTKEIATVSLSCYYTSTDCARQFSFGKCSFYKHLQKITLIVDISSNFLRFSRNFSNFLEPSWQLFSRFCSNLKFTSTICGGLRDKIQNNTYSENIDIPTVLDKRP